MDIYLVKFGSDLSAIRRQRSILESLDTIGLSRTGMQARPRNSRREENMIFLHPVLEEMASTRLRLTTMSSIRRMRLRGTEFFSSPQRPVQTVDWQRLLWIRQDWSIL